MAENIPGATQLPENNATPAQLKELGLNAADTSKFKPVEEPLPGIVSTGIMSEEERKNSANLGDLTKEAVEKNTNLTTSKTRSRIDGVEFSAIDPALNPTSVEVTADNKPIPQEKAPGPKQEEDQVVDETPADVDRSKEQKQEAEPDSVELIAAAEKQKAQEKAEKASKELIAKLNNGKLSALLGSGEQEIAVLIATAKIPSDSNTEECFIAIAKDRVLKMEATAEVKRMIYERWFHPRNNLSKNFEIPEGDIGGEIKMFNKTSNVAETLSTVPLSNENGTYDLIDKTIDESIRKRDEVSKTMLETGNLKNKELRVNGLLSKLPK